MYLIYLKNPGVSFLVDSFDEKELGDLQVLKTTQEGFPIIIPVLATSNITYIKELSEEELKKVKEQILLSTGKIEAAKGVFDFPKKGIN